MFLKIRKLIITMFCALTLTIVSYGNIAAIEKIELNASLYTHIVGTLIMAGAEYPVAEKLAIYARIGNFAYSYTDLSDYHEDGRGNYIGAGVSIYPITPRQKLHIGVGLEQINGKTDWEDDNKRGDIEISGTSPAVTIGYKWLIDNEFVVEPNVLYVNIPSGDLKNSVIVGLGVLVGLRF
ncbi:MAG: porin family protein [Proteobacteria bacterium]|nr:porin family protein [Pseudomonadota bacterium]